MTRCRKTRLVRVVSAALAVASGAAYAQGNLENPAPDGHESGIGLISGWLCSAGRVEIGFDGGPLARMAYGTSRADTAAVCGDTDNGFGLLYNFNLLGSGTHVARLYADGVLFATRTFNVATLGGEFITGLSRNFLVDNFPGPGQGAVVRWQESKQNFVIERLTSVPAPGFNPTGHWREAGDSSGLWDIQKDDAGHLSVMWLNASDLTWFPLEGDLAGQTARVSFHALGIALTFDLNFATRDSATMTVIECVIPGVSCGVPLGDSVQLNRCATVGMGCL